MKKLLLYFVATVLTVVFIVQKTEAQQADSTGANKVKLTKKERKAEEKKRFPKKSSFFSNIFKKVRSSITVSPQDSINKSTIINTKSVIPYIEHQDKVIRRIDIKELGFDKVFTDTLKRFNNFGNRVLNALHTNTNDWVIRDNLFIAKGERINPFLLSDNERYLRSLEFLQDARIIVKAVSGSYDSVDIEIVTKDLFSITGSVDLSGVDRQKFTAAETNLAGAGQKVQVTALRDINRNPSYGYDFLYSKNSIAHSFINGTIGYSRINSDPFAIDNVESFYLQLSRPLISPYSRLAGALSLDFNKSNNTSAKPDSLFYDYRNVNIDAWAGFNIGVNKFLHNERLRNRTFIAARYIRRNFSEKPFQLGKGFHNFFDNRRAILGEVTFFRQEFYKTNYIYGFGTTEDVPYGYNVAVTGGWYKQQDLARPYFGVNANKYIATERGRFMQFYARSGFFINKGKMEDVAMLFGGSMFSRLHLFRNFKWRQYFKYNISRVYSRTTYDPLQINNSLGLRYFSADTLRGTQRMSLYTESFFFAKYKFLGFQLAPFVFLDASLLKGEGKPFYTSDIYTGIGGGVRTRNVNLVFGTAEIRMVYFPRKAQEDNSFKISFNTEIRFRNNSNYIRPPDVIQLNSEDSNSFY